MLPFILVLVCILLIIALIAILNKPTPNCQVSSNISSSSSSQPIPSLGSIMSFVNHTTDIYIVYRDTIVGGMLSSEQLLYAVAIIKSKDFLEKNIVSAPTIFYALRAGEEQCLCTKDYSKSWSWPKSNEVSSLANMIVMLMSTLAAADLKVMPYGILDTILEQQEIIYYTIQAKLNRSSSCTEPGVGVYDLILECTDSRTFFEAMQQYDALQNK